VGKGALLRAVPTGARRCLFGWARFALPTLRACLSLNFISDQSVFKHHASTEFLKSTPHDLAFVKLQNRFVQISN
jgi:hypothetical protein